MSLLDTLSHGGLLRPIDLALARTLRRLDPDTPDAVLVAAALASLAVAKGHAAFDPQAPSRLVEGPIAWPAPSDWLASLTASRWVGQPAADQHADARAPLVLEHGLVYLRRYRQYEARLAHGLARIAAHTRQEGDIAGLAAVFAALFPAASTPGITEDRQARAAALALRRALLLVTGGPGTGKTTTITRLLVLRIAQAVQAGLPPPRIALAAPTGRAAERMAESLRRAVHDIVSAGVDAALCAALPDAASTVHRLLGTLPDVPHFRHNRAHPLPFDILVIDEASMLDLPLMCKLVDAVADDAQLILLGDADQLPSVEAGDVLAAILAAAGPGNALRTEDAHALQPLLGDATPVEDAVAGLRGHRVQLLRGYRQEAGFNLAPLADAARAGEADTALALLRGGQLCGVSFHEDVLDPFEVHRDALLAHWRSLADAPDPATALALSQRVRLLTAVRAGPQGARGLNARIEELLSGRRPGAAPTYFHGRLLLVTENSYRHRLFNGDIGLCLEDAAGVLKAWFPGDIPGAVRAFHPAALPRHDSAFAMTVHKAQGSEFDEVWLQLPRKPSRVLSRELVYTAITRARTRLHVAGSAQVLRDALARHAERVSGLGWRLGGDDGQPAMVIPPASSPPEPPAPDSTRGTLF